MTAVLAVITVALYIAGGSGSMGQVIDEQFLATLARQEYYKAVGKVFRGLAFFTGCTTFVYVIGLDMHKRRDKQAKGILLACLLFAAMGIGFALYNSQDLSVRRNVKPHMQTEKLGYKNKISGRNAKYYLYFSSGSRQSVDRGEYERAPLGAQYYVVYQGSLVIKSFLAQR